MNTMEFAAYELNRYAATMGIHIQVKLIVDAEQFDRTKFFRFDVRYDDAFVIDVKSGAGTITATNERAVLLGVYHFLKKQGCRFLKPGKDGEYIPLLERVQDVSETWYAKTRHRGTTDRVCHSDALGAEGMLAFIDWLPKAMMNSYFIELPDYYDDLKLALEHRKNPYKDAEELTYERYLQYDAWIVEEMKKRGLIRHGAGHGWTIMMMDGIDDITSKAVDAVCANPEILAEIDGERKTYNSKPLHTNLCYSQAKVRRKMAENVYAYSVEHPEVDFIHVWLADYFNNFCECENCRKLAQSDWYIKILNEIDEVFTAHGSDKKIVFLIYFELAYLPIQERINNEDRFVMMFAPYGRDFTKAYREWEEVPHAPAPLNQFKREYMHMGRYLYLLKQWQQIFKGDSFVFDYSLYDAVSHTEVTNVGFAPVPYQDCMDLTVYGLNGRIECGQTNAMTPTSLILYSMADAMFYGEKDFAEIEEDYFTVSYGEEQKVLPFLKEMSVVLPTKYMLCKTKLLTEEDAARLQGGLDRVREFKKEFINYMPTEAVHRQNCRYFREYLELLEFVFLVMRDKALGCSEEQIEEYIEKYRHLVFRKEEIMPLYMSGRSWLGHISLSFRNKKQENEFTS